MLDDIRRQILVEKEQAEAGDFPHNIQEHFWVRGGENDGDSWLATGQLTTGAYFFYSGGCDYTGFDCQGGMSLWISNSWENIIDHAMTEGEYELYIHQNEPQEEPELCPKCQTDPATMPNEFDDECERICADCFWDLDADLKARRRADPEWRYGRAYSAAKVLLNKTDEEAHAVAAAAVAGRV
jgi:hypothetical protein